MRERQFAYKRMLRMITDENHKEKIPWAVKDALLALMHPLYIDREPYEKVGFCQLTRVWPAINTSLLDLDEAASGSVQNTYLEQTSDAQVKTDQDANVAPFELPTAGFKDLQGFISRHLKTMKVEMKSEELRSTQLNFTCTVRRQHAISRK